MRKTIVQAYNLKTDLEKLGIAKNKYTAASFDAIAMYPSISFSMVKQAVQYFSKDLPKKDKKTIEKCLKMIGFGIGNTLVWFRDKCYQYGSVVDKDRRRLTIVGYESA